MFDDSIARCFASRHALPTSRVAQRVDWERSLVCVTGSERDFLWRYRDPPTASHSLIVTDQTDVVGLCVRRSRGDDFLEVSPRPHAEGQYPPHSSDHHRTYTCRRNRANPTRYHIVSARSSPIGSPDSPEGRQLGIPTSTNQLRRRVFHRWCAPEWPSTTEQPQPFSPRALPAGCMGDLQSILRPGASSMHNRIPGS